MRLRNGAIINDRYIIEEKIGSGGMAIVYRATDTKLDRTVTLKVMREDYIQDDEFIERFYTEAQAAAKLNHPNIVKVYDVDRIGDILFIVMEFIDGITLKEAIRARRMFKNDEILGVSIQIASAIDCAHKHQIVHRDIKPQNILLTRSGEVKVTDFGIARAANAKTTTATSTTLGSVHYFSPEQARGGYVDHKSDIYALGITMFEMASGQLPFDDETVVTIALKHINDDLPEIRQFNPNVSDSVINIINKATEKSQIKRYENAEIMGNDLKKALTDQSLNVNIHYDEKMTQTLKMSEDDINAIRARNKRHIEFEDTNGEYFENIENVQNSERGVYHNKQKNSLRGRKPVAMNDNYEDDYEQNYEDVYDEEYEYEDKYMHERRSKKTSILYAVLTGLFIGIIIVSSAIWSFNKNTKDTMEVPIIMGMDINDAQAMANEQNFKIEIYEEIESDVHEPGKIIEQNYQAGDKFYPGDTIRVKVSVGSNEVTVPNVEGKLSDEAIDEIERNDLKVRIKNISDDVIKVDRVVEQIPEPNTTVKAGSLVTIYVSTGVQKGEQVVVPNVVGITEVSAKSELGAANLNVNTVYKPSSYTMKDYVISQSISAGEEVAKYTEVTIVVSSGTGEEKQEEPQEVVLPEEEQMKSKTIVVDQGMIPSGYETVFVKVVDDATGEIIYEKEVGVNDFPINLTVRGTGSKTYLVYTKVEGGTYKQTASSEVKFSS